MHLMPLFSQYAPQASHKLPYNSPLSTLIVCTKTLMDSILSAEKASPPHEDGNVVNETNEHEPSQHTEASTEVQPPAEQQPEFLGQNSDAIELSIDDNVAKSRPATDEKSQAPLVEISAPADENDAEANSSISHMHLTSMRSFTTPLKLLPPLKDIEHITTPKSFGVAKDDTQSHGAFKSSPVQTQNSMQLGNLNEEGEEAFDNTVNDTFANTGGPSHLVAESNSQLSAEIETAAAFLDVHPQALLSVEKDLVAKVTKRAQKLLRLQSEFSFFKLNQEQMNQVQQKKYEQLQNKLESLSSANQNLLSENEANSLELLKKNDVMSDLRKHNFSLSEKVQQLELAIHEASNGKTSKDHEFAQLNETVSVLTQSNAEQGQRISELTRDLNDSTNESFSLRLELSKATNELSYTKNQKDWYESQLKSVQDKYTELIKRHDTDSLRDSNQISSLLTQTESLGVMKESLQAQVKELQARVDQTSNLRSDLETQLEVLQSRFAKESGLKDEKIELLNIQLKEKNDRISQLESYAEDMKSSTANSIESLQREVSEREDKLLQVEEKLRRAEEALDSELHKETKLPKLAQSAELILQESGLGISLSALYTEFNHIKKELVLEKLQKEKLATQLQHFIAELESKKPAIANYRNQIVYYEGTLKDVLAKMEAIRIEKIESEKECVRLRTRLASYENEIVSIRQLSKDLGRQLCFYLIHSKIREGNEDPLSPHDKKVIDQILAKSGNKDTSNESDTDQLITERLIGFNSIIELQKRNEELTVAVRLLGKQLESKDTEPNGFEAVAVEEAKEAILTLQSELDSITLKYEAVCKERDMMKFLDGNSLSAENGKMDLRLVQEANAELKKKFQDAENMLKTLQSQSLSKLRNLGDELIESKTLNEDLKAKITAAKHSVEILESRSENTNKLLENARRDIELSQKEIQFWKSQASKQEEILVKRSNEVRDLEQKLMSVLALQNSLQTEKEVWTSLQNSLSQEIQYLKRDKDQLNSFVSNLQALLKERETSSSQLSNKLSQSVANYQALQEKINEKEDRILVLASQSEMAWRAQNTKLEQVNELSQKLLEARGKVADKQKIIDSLKNQLASGAIEKHSNRTSSALTNHSTVEEGSPVLASEYNDLKDALKVAEAQVTEFSEIAKSAEDALKKATESFDEFREASNAKLEAVEAEKNLLLKQAENQKSQIDDLQNQLRQNDLQASSSIQELLAKLQESSLKASSYDEMKLDFEKKLSSMGQDLKNQISISDDTQRRYESKASEVELLNSQLAHQKDKITEQESIIRDLRTDLELTSTKLQDKEDLLKEQLSGQQETLQSVQTKLSDLQYQYDLALTQLELQKPFSESEDPQSSDNLRQVVSYLRAEKDSAESKAKMASDQVSQLKIQLDNAIAELKASKSQLARLQTMKLELEKTNKDHSRLMEQLEQLNILRESNITLRKENQSCAEQIADLESQIKSLKQDSPHASKNNVEDDVKSQEVRLLKEENERLKNLRNNEELDRLRQRFEKLKSEFLTKLTNHRNKNRELEKQLAEIKLQLESAQGELTATKLSVNNDAKASALSAQLKQLEDDKTQAEKKFTAEITKLKNDYESQKTELEANFRSKLAEANSTSSKSAGNLEARIKQTVETEWKQKLEKAISELKEKFERDQAKIVEERVSERILAIKNEDPKQDLQAAQDRMKKEYDDKISALNQSFENKLASEKASAEKAIETKYEFKLKVLNRRLEKLLEKDANGQQDSGRSGSSATAVQPSKQTSSDADQQQSAVQQGQITETSAISGSNQVSSEGVDGSSNNQGNVTSLGAKRPLSQDNTSATTFKRPKE